MSCYEWERGEFKLPSAEWSAFKQTIRDVVNAGNKTDYEFALKLHAAVVVALKGAKKPDIRQVAWDEAAKLNPSSNYYPPKYTEDTISAAIEGVVDQKWDDITRKSTVRVKKPQKKDFPQHGNTATEFSNSDCSLHFDNASRTATWSVNENNHACDRARESKLGTALFKALDKVKWTRGTGGSIVGNDEYNRDARDEGGGGNFSKGSYGPEEDKRKAAASKMRNPYGGFRY